ncbi:hypothetical protein V6Z11_A11G246300 [Gossypium hirsutum]
MASEALQQTRPPTHRRLLPSLLRILAIRCRLCCFPSLSAIVSAATSGVRFLHQSGLKRYKLSGVVN